MFRSKLRKAMAAVMFALVASATGVVVSAAPAQAADVCYWIDFPGHSNCDGLSPTSLEAECGGGTTVRHEYLRRSYDNWQSPILVEIRYNWTCQTVWGRISYGYGPGAGHDGCTVFIVRDATDQARLKHVAAGETGAYTDVLYDDGTTAHAYAHCDNIGYSYSAATTSW